LTEYHSDRDEDEGREYLQRIIEECEDEMISHYMGGQSHERNKELIQEFYEANLKTRKETPSLEDIMTDVYAHNSEQVWRIAATEYDVEGWHGLNETEDTREETINMLCEPWEEYYSDFNYCNLNSYVEDILEELNLCYYYEDVHDQYTTLEIFQIKNDVVAVLNDCQNILYDEFMEAADDERGRFPGRVLFLVSDWRRRSQYEYNQNRQL